MRKKIAKSNYNLLLLGSMLAGLGLASFNIPLIFQSAEIVSGIFLKLLKFLSLPLVFFAIGSTITSIKNFQIMLSLGSKVLYYTLLTTIIAATIGLGLFLIIYPVMPLEEATASASATCSTGYLKVLANTIPGNILEPFLENNVISATFLAALLGISSLFLAEKEKHFTQTLFSTFFSILLNIAKGILKLLIPATMAFSILFYKEVTHSQGNLVIFSKYLLCVVGANLIQGCIVLPWLLKANKLSPIKIAKSMSPALITAFFSKSSASTLPLTMELAEEELKIKPSLSRLAFPLCSVINMNGCAAFILITVLFVATSNGVSFSIFSMIGWIFIATLCAVGNAGVPMGCFFLASSLITSMQIPLHLLGLILPFYTVLDMIETSLNVWSDCCVVSMTNKHFSDKFIELE
ncbi:MULTISPECIES: dicarboxylate/amino acid:cation symporter [Chlamydia]|uniref:Dicarboxylate symporter family protein n=2 Tax=Chlamydia TaxID=810 RepID=A0ABP2X2F3_CHLPS|nr:MULTISPECIES: dicarboxylate/amino acid:cation symporter [Chlamydia]AFS22731.1 dicarboxylate symporter family protein [Chlamydia psittaci VS225]EPJ15586.1 dicarboxylate symporter family protein [Chlamydia psittaci 02DC18]EPJ16658.1 dicarboxylate symporter family protein [Chlamydia psittaci 02DC22]EPJ20186.1 dicarboxylate symporter family protein [Chlamydia psittaci 02DC21]EPJ21280.1 dicarboxylate symporter family protein [Chlamydia psittaci 02DC23]EPJ23052.1 dicarboxylate symporter family p